MKLTRRAFIQSGAALAATAAAERASFAAPAADVSASLKLGGFGGEAQQTAIVNAIARFNKRYPNVQVELIMDAVPTGWGDYVTKVLSQFNAGNAADIYGTAIETFQAFASRGLWLSLDDFIKSNPSFSDFAPSLFELSSYKGSVQYMPIGWNNIMVNFNRALFDKAGVPYPKPDWTWDEFREVAKKLTVKDSSGTVSQYGYEVPNQNFFVQPWFLTNGTSPLNTDWTASNMTDPKVAESLQFLHDLIHVDGVSPIPGAETMDNQFFAGQVAMISRGHWIVQGAMTNNIDLDVVGPAAKTSGTTVLGFGGYAINKDTKNADLARELLTDLTSKETQIEEGEGGGGVPGRKSALTEKFLSFPHNADRYYATLSDVKAVPSPANFQEVEKIFIRYYTAMMADEVSIADGCKQAHDELNASFARLKGG